MSNRKQLTTPGGVIATFVSELTRDDIRKMLKLGKVRFVVDDVRALEWKPEDHCFDFWKLEVQPHFSEPAQTSHLEEWPGEYFYFAAQWDDGGTPIVLLRKMH